MLRKELAPKMLLAGNRTRGWFGAASLLAVVLCCSLSCRRDPKPGEAPGKPVSPAPAQPSETTVFVSILPQAYFVERVAGGHVGVEVLVGPDQSPHSYEPTPSQMNALAKAPVLFRIGVRFEESLLPKIRGAFKHLEIVDTRQGITLRRMKAVHPHGRDHAGQHGQRPEQDEHKRGPGAGGDDPHIWLAPKLVQIQARTICETLCRIDPLHAEEYRRNLSAFQADLDALDAKLAEALAPLKGREFFVFHPAYGYFADAYGLKQVPVEIEGKQPGAKDIAALIKRAKRTGAKVIFVQAQFSQSSARAIARQIGGVVVALDPLARDYIRNLESKAEQIKRALADH